MNRSLPRTADVFCRVVDNFGDAAFGWRLARQLAAEHGWTVRLWIDDPETLARLAPQVDPLAARQTVDGIEVARRAPDADFGAPAEIVIDAFGGGLPDAYVDAMAACADRGVPAPLWIITEYLSAEPWVASHHAKPSPHPRLPIPRFFFFPGFDANTGGLLREAGYAARARAFAREPNAIGDLWRAVGAGAPREDAARVSLFAYENPATDALLDALAAGPAPVDLVVPLGRVAPAVARHLGIATAAGAIAERGALRAHFVPFMPQPRYDELLWACDWNFVRGEDSFLRAQWAARPFCWHIYPQAQATHHAKLAAFLRRYVADLHAAVTSPFVTLWHAWNAVDATPPAAIAPAWRALADPRAAAALAGHAVRWAERLAGAGEFTARLVGFCEERLTRSRGANLL